MSWHAQAGTLVLEGKEAELFRDAILYMCDLIEGAVEDEDSKFGGAAAFDKMSRSQQIASLEVVSEYLFHRTEGCHELTAWSEATIASILHEIRGFVHVEIDEGDSSEYRNTIREILGDELELVDPNSHSEWDQLIDAYTERFLWDDDFQDNQIADLSPEHASHLRTLLSIPGDYFTAIPPDLESEWHIRGGRKRVWLAIDGKKTIRMIATITCEVPASYRIQQESEDLVTLSGYFPSVIIMRHQGDGNAEQAGEGDEEFFLDGSEMDHAIEEVKNDLDALGA